MLTIEAFNNGKNIPISDLNFISSKMRSVRALISESFLSENQSIHNCITIKIKFLDNAKRTALIDGKPVQVNTNCSKLKFVQISAIYKPERRRRQALIIGATALLGSIIGAETATLVHNSESADNFEAEAKHIKESDLTESEGFHDILEQFSKGQRYLNLEPTSSIKFPLSFLFKPWSMYLLSFPSL